MYKTNLRKVGGSIMLAVPPAFLDQLHLQAGATVGLTVNHGCLVVNPSPRPRYTLAELLADSDYSRSATGCGTRMGRCARCRWRTALMHMHDDTMTWCWLHYPQIMWTT